MMVKPRANLRLSPKLNDALCAAAERPGVTKTAILEAALQQFLLPQEDKGLEARLLARMDAFDERQVEGHAGHIANAGHAMGEIAGEFRFVPNVNMRIDQSGEERFSCAVNDAQIIRPQTIRKRERAVVARRNDCTVDDENGLIVERFGRAGNHGNEAHIVDARCGRLVS